MEDPRPVPAQFNRQFVSSQPDEDIVRTLILGPSLIKKPFKLKKLILQTEDRGFGVRTA